MCIFEGPKIQAFEKPMCQAELVFFLEEASNKWLVYRSDFFFIVWMLISSLLKRQASCDWGVDMKEKKDEFEGGPNEPQKKDGESENVEKMAF